MKKLIATVLLAASLTACAGRAAQVYVQADSAAVAALSQFKAEKDVRCDAGQIPASSCQALAQAFVPVWDAYLATNALITAEAPLLEVDAAVADYKKAGIGLRDAVANVQGSYRQILLDLLERAIRQFDRGTR